MVTDPWAPLLIYRAQYAWRRYGFFGSLRKLLHLVRILPDRRRRRRLDREYDRRHAVETGGIVRLQALDIESENRDLGVRYEATNPTWFRNIVGSLPVDCREFTFVDYGAGKGRALLLASEFPFKRIIGVEFSPELVEIARRNVARFESEHQQCTDFEVVCADAVEYELPDEPAVLYFYNPFAEPVFLRVLQGIRRSFERAPRPLLVVVTGDAPLGALAAAGFAPLGPENLPGGQRVFLPVQ